MKSGNPTFASLGTTIFADISALAVQHRAMNLGQGFPDGSGPDDVRAEAARRVLEGPHQYPPYQGVPELRAAVAAHDVRFYGLEVGPANVLVTSGATEALASCLLALLAPGDEAIVIDPAYDSYRPMIRSVGAAARSIRLEPPHWRLTRDMLGAAFTPRTKLLLLNTPQNPIGKVYGDEELGLIAEFACRHDAYVVCDEVYEHLIFDGLRHRPLLTFPGMAGRTLKIGSAGKTFSLTGWKVGYITGGVELINLVSKAHQFLTFTTPPNLQYAVAYGLAKEDGYYHGLTAELECNRNRLRGDLEDLGFQVLPCQGTYFLVADYTPLGVTEDADAYARRLIRDAGVAAIPLSAFYEEQPKGQRLLRFCFCKSDAVLSEAVRRLKAYYQSSMANNRTALDAVGRAT